ncbi:MAG: DUF4835 family protein [Ignavibacteria bacterium]|nr:DUF4835 family protein [Ignavibacteria bacterium]
MKKIFALIFLFACAAAGFAQELDATVTVNFQNLPQLNKENLVRFENDLKNYVNSTRFSGQEWRYQKIKCSFNISINTATGDNSYMAQVVVISQRNIHKTSDFTMLLRIFDNNWSFNYEKNQQLISNPTTFNSLLSFIDYYALLIIGMENDSWDKLSGTPFFAKANEIALMGANTPQKKGWESTSGTYNRRDFTENLLSEKYRVVREAFADYHYGLDMMSQRIPVAQKKEQYYRAGQERIAGFVRSVDGISSKLDINSFYVKAVFEAKYLELAERLKDYPDKQIFRMLKSVDNAHSTKYDEMLKK